MNEERIPTIMDAVRGRTDGSKLPTFTEASPEQKSLQSSVKAWCEAQGLSSDSDIAQVLVNNAATLAALSQEGIGSRLPSIRRLRANKLVTNLITDLVENTERASQNAGLVAFSKETYLGYEADQSAEFDSYVLPRVDTLNNLKQTLDNSGLLEPKKVHALLQKAAEEMLTNKVYASGIFIEGVMRWLMNTREDKPDFKTFWQLASQEKRDETVMLSRNSEKGNQEVKQAKAILNDKSAMRTLAEMISK